jgi:putative membrane protein
MRNLLLHWILSAISVWVVSEIVPGFTVSGAGAALAAALFIGLINGTLGFFLKIVTLPLTILTFGIFLLIINALMLMLVSSILQGFQVDGFLTAFIGAIVLAIVNSVLGSVMKAD